MTAPPEVVRRPLPRPAQRDGEAGQLAPQPGGLGVQRVHAVVGAEQVGQRRRRVLAPGEDVVDGVAVPTGQAREVGPSLLDLGQAGGVDVDVGEVGRQVGRQVGGEVGQLGDAALQLTEGGVVVGHRSQRGPRGGQRVGHRCGGVRRIPVVADEVGVGLRRRQP